MVTVDPELLIPLHMFITIFFIVVFAFLKKFAIENKNWFMLGMFFGAMIYFMLVLGSTIKESNTLPEFLLKYIALGFGGTYYVAILIFSASISLMILLREDTKKRIMNRFKGKEERLLYIITGMALIFSICGIYFALRCVETIPFFENFVSTNSTCS